MAGSTGVPEGAAASAEQKPIVATSPSRGGVDLLTGPEGEVMGFSISPAAKLYATVDQLIASPRLVALRIAQRYALAGQVAAVPGEHPRLVERLASAVATSWSEVGALNALYLLETCKELVPGFGDAIPADRLAKAAELSPHQRVQDAIRLGQQPPEWEAAKTQQAAPHVVLFNHDDEEEDIDLLCEAGRAVGDGAKFLGASAFGGVGLVTDTLGLTRGAEDDYADTAEDAVDLLGHGVGSVLDTYNDGVDGTADDFHEKGFFGAVDDGMADAVDIVTDFAGDAVHGIAGGVHSVLSFFAGEDEEATPLYPTHKLMVSVAELFGEERSLGLRIENRVVTFFTKPEAASLGWVLGDCILGVGQTPTHTQDDLLAQIAVTKEALKNSGTPIRFIVERLGPKPAVAPGPLPGTLIFVGGRAARVRESDGNSAVVEFQDDHSVARVPLS